jgi:integrase
MDHWTIHDLRRSVATSMGELDISEEAIGRCLGHKRDRLQRTYNQSEGLAAKRQAFERWTAHLAGIIEPRSSKVVEMRR